MAWAKCWHHDRMLTFRGFGGMGTFHSNYYSCSECGDDKILSLYDDSIQDGHEYFNMNKRMYEYGLHDIGRAKAKNKPKMKVKI